MSGVTALIVVLPFLYSLIAAQAGEHSPDGPVARLSYSSTYGVDWREQKNSPRICFALYRSGRYRILRLKEQGTEMLQASLAQDKFASLGRMFKRLDSESKPAGIIRQGSESFIAEISGRRENVHFLWVDPDHERPSPDSASEIINWLQKFEALGSSTATIKELGQEPICPTAAEKPYRPLIAGLSGSSSSKPALTSQPTRMAIAGPRRLQGSVEQAAPIRGRSTKKLPPADRRNDGNLTSMRGWRSKSAGVANIFTSYEHADMLPDLALFVCHAIANAGITCP